MNVVINTNFSAALASTKICVCDLEEKLKEEGFKVTCNDWDNYKKYDLIIFMGYDSRVKTARKANPKAIIGICSPFLATKRQQINSKLADFLMLDSIETRDIFLKYNKNILIYYPIFETKIVEKVHKGKDKIIIGYHGTKRHLEHMKEVSDALDELSEKYKIEFWAMYNIKTQGNWKRNVPKKCVVKHIQWSEENYYRYLAQCDIGITPAKIPINLRFGRIATQLLDSFLNNWPKYESTDYLVRFKYPTNPGRVYTFSQLHIPVVADFLPSYSQAIQDGHSGYLAYSKEGWYYALEKLIQNPELRNTMSRNLKEYFDKNCSPDINFQRFLEFIKAIKDEKEI